MITARPKYFNCKNGRLPLPVFFPDATRAIVKSLDTADIKSTQTPGLLVNTFHLYLDLDPKILKKFNGIRSFMNWDDGLISDSGGFQVMSLAKSGPFKGKVTDEGVIFRPSRNKKILFTPEDSIRFQMLLKPDMLVVLDDFTPPNASYRKAKETVERTILWAKRCKEEFLSQCEKEKIKKENIPYLLAVVQGGDYSDLRKECTERLVEIGFDGLGYGGWPIDKKGKFNYEVAECIAKNSPKNYFLYGLGVGKPEEIIGCTEIGFKIYDCVLPTRDARHGRLYVYNAKSINDINIRQKNFYSFYSPKNKDSLLDEPVSLACDCLLCKNYPKSYLSHLFRVKDFTAGRLSSIHNLRFYSLLMKNLQEKKP